MMVVVTLESPRGPITLAVPNDVPVEQLLPALVEACRCEQAASQWSLRARGEAPLAPDRTLEQAGLYQGAILELRAEEPVRPRNPPRHLASWAEVGVYYARRLAAASAAKRAVAPLPAAADRRQLSEPDRRIASAVLPRGLLIAVLGRERGAGATTVAALLATLLARLRADLVAAVDTDPVSGSLSLSLTPGRRVAAADLLSVLTQGSGGAALRPHLVAEQHGLLVLPAPILAGGAARLDQAVYTALLAQLTRSAELAVVDCGVADLPGGRAALASADLGVVVCRVEEAGSRRVDRSLLALRASCQSVVVVVNRVRRPRAGRGARLRVPGADHTISLTDDPAAGARLRAAAFSWESAPRSWQAEVRALASALLVDRLA